MSFLRRFYLVLITLALVASLSLFLLFPQTVNNWSAALSDQSPLIPVLVTAVLDILLLTLLYLQVRPDPRERATGLMMQASGAITEVSVESARDRILKAVSDVPDVISADAEVKPIRGKADVELQVTVMGHDVQLPAKQKEINRALNQVIHKQLGLRMAGQPRVHIRFHNEKTVPSTSFVATPIEKPVEIAPPKPIAVAAEVTPSLKPAPVEPEPHKSFGLFNLPKREKADHDDKEVINPPVVKVAEEPPKLEGLPANEPEKDEVFGLDLEKEIANSAADDIEIDEVEKDPVEADEDEKDESKPSGMGDYEKENGSH